MRQVHALVRRVGQDANALATDPLTTDEADLLPAEGNRPPAPRRGHEDGPVCQFVNGGPAHDPIGEKVAAEGDDVIVDLVSAQEGSDRLRGDITGQQAAMAP